MVHRHDIKSGIMAPEVYLTLNFAKAVLEIYLGLPGLYTSIILAH